jgi:hypothetical protein
MNDNTIDLGRTNEEVLTSEVSDEARLPLREFSHRINNEFASAIGVISIAARSANESNAGSRTTARAKQIPVPGTDSRL